MPIPPCETTGLVNLCGQGAILTNGDWFTLQISNLVWFLILLGLIVIAIALPFPARAVEDTGSEQSQGQSDGRA